jgi:hypothetical protein
MGDKEPTVRDQLIVRVARSVSVSVSVSASCVRVGLSRATGYVTLPYLRMSQALHAHVCGCEDVYEV